MYIAVLNLNQWIALAFFLGSWYVMKYTGIGVSQQDILWYARALANKRYKCHIYLLSLIYHHEHAW